MKHAYMIMAHHEPMLLSYLIKKLDHSDNDIYIHIDKKSFLKDEDFSSLCEKSKIYFVDRVDVGWGHYSQIECEMVLLKAAIKGRYDYYHLITGVDLPLKPVEEINKYFEESNGKDFVDFDAIDDTALFSERYDRWHLFKRPRKKGFIYTVYRKFIALFSRVLFLLLGPRSKKYDSNFKMKKGSAYFDITHDLAEYIVSKEPEIQKMFAYTSCCDEVFLQTYAYNSKFQGNLVSAPTRYIDWRNCTDSPKTLTMEHKAEILESEAFFARKFSTVESRELIEALFDDFSFNK